jgi:hypothetical protein
MNARKATQDEILKLLREGWAIGLSGGQHASWWMQKNGLGRGGEHRDVHSASAFALYKKGLIEIKGARSFPHTEYQLTELGRADRS